MSQPPNPRRRVTELEVPLPGFGHKNEMAESGTSPTIYAPVCSLADEPLAAQFAQVKPQPTASPETKLYGPSLRQATAKLVVMDDGSITKGEVIRIRKAEFVIGRQLGDLVLEYDLDVSARHASLKLIPSKGTSRWQLSDENSTNGTFVRVSRAAVMHQSEVIIGTTRYRIDLAHADTPTSQETKQPITTRVHGNAVVGQTARPTLKFVNVAASENYYEISMKGANIGTDPLQSEVLIDDPCVCPRHARFLYSSDRWIIEDTGSVNGVWLRVKGVWLDENAEFQVGEQRFRFSPSGCLGRGV